MKPDRSARMGTAPVVPLLIKLAVPGMIGMASHALYNVVDSIFVARLSTRALSALSLAFPIQMVLIALAVGTGMGATSLISRTLGRGDTEKAGRIAEHVLLMGLILGLTAAAVGILFSRQLLGLFTAEEELITMGSRYIRIIMIGSTMMFTPMVTNSILRGEGNTFIPMVTMIIGAGLNIALDPLLIYGIGPFPALGVPGAAAATILSRIVSGSFVLLILFSDKNEIKIRLRHFRFQPRIIGGIYQIGAPAMMMQLLASVMLAGGNLILAGYSTTAIAVFGIFFRLQSFVLMPVFGLGQGAMPMTGYNYGRGSRERLGKTVRAALLGGWLITVTGMLIFQFLAEPILRLFNSDPEMLAIGIPALRRISLGFFFIGPSIMAANVFQGLGRGLPSLTLGFARTILVLLPAMYLLGEAFGLDALWYAFPLSEGITFSLGMTWLALTLHSVLSSLSEGGPDRGVPGS